ncbi:c-type cytochrome biogenesis protein CcmI [Aureimonas fodinaquatilis]|uniref:C-type cytochrome biogenesis protein CcmI n=1 Tax=Aureimonas fodinaquatilis TaxID=2565783 RepID=A0A5B0DX27_9HYPH|nr:c-type cytochrome biogenesis protein CcmI [Aureimonas fodinaquatilis]KAA0971056.1 c-type cytochrome biogenesis protein CcmI [Aureimonas fodinaquatilis]
MLFWIIAAALTAIVTLAAVWPLLRSHAALAEGRAAHDVMVYEAQLKELEADLGRGVIRGEEASVARAEIARRLLKASREASAEGGLKTSARMAWIAGLILLAVPVAGVTTYYWLGAPLVEDMPLAIRDNDAADAEFAALVAAAEARLVQNPDEGAGWDALAPIYLRTGQSEKAVQAFSRAIDLLGATPRRLTGYGEALIQQAGGRVSEQAGSAFAQALELDPQALLPRFFLALALSQQDRLAEAVPAWQSLIDDSPENSPWLPTARAALEEARSRTGMVAVPEADGLAAIAALPENERQQAIGDMVAGLAARLEQSPDDAQGWLRLIRSYTIMERKDDAARALRTALATFSPGSPEEQAIAALARDLNLEPADEVAQ